MIRTRKVSPDDTSEPSRPIAAAEARTRLVQPRRLEELDVHPELIRELTAVALEAAEIGASVQRDGWASGFTVEAKGAHGDVVTEIDLAAEDAMRKFVESARPQDSFIGEERGAPERLGTVCWIVDPIDGTANYLRRSVDCAVSIGVSIGGVRAIGVVQQAETGRQWVGSPTGATRNTEPIKVAARNTLAETVWATGFSADPVDRERQVEFFSQMMAHVRDCRRTGSPALDLAHVADGTVDGYVEFGLGVEDYAGGAALVEAAGGYVEVVDIGPWRGPLVIAAGARALVQAMRTIARDAGVPNA